MVERKSIDPALMALRGRIGAYRLHATHDSREITAPARARFLERFDREVDPDGSLPDNERRRRAALARRAYFAKLAYRSVEARRRKSIRAPESPSDSPPEPGPEGEPAEMDLFDRVLAATQSAEREALEKLMSGGFAGEEERT